jgi:hypothetical protein
VRPGLKRRSRIDGRLRKRATRRGWRWASMSKPVNSIPGAMCHASVHERSIATPRKVRRYGPRSVITAWNGPPLIIAARVRLHRGSTKEERAERGIRVDLGEGRTTPGILPSRHNFRTIGARSPKIEANSFTVKYSDSVMFLAMPIANGVLPF